MASTRKQLILLGATGSIGTSTIDLVRRMPERFEVVAMTAHRRHAELATLLREFDGAWWQLGEDDARAALEADFGARALAPGHEGFVEALERFPGAMVVNGLVGASGLRPTFTALERGYDVALANKEALVVGGELVLGAARRGGARIWPVDSEHSAIAQCLRGNPPDEVAKLWLTASGGPFRDRDPETLADVTLEEVLNHPTWDMGPKITVDSASMMNKGLEVLEAHFLFDVPIERIGVVIHRESIVHSMIELRDGAFLAQMGAPDMRVPILFALTEGVHAPTDVAPWSPLGCPTLHFEEPDLKKYPCLTLARRAGEAGGAAPIVLNAANEVAVAAVLRGELSFVGIASVIERALGAIPLDPVHDVDEALDRDHRTREQASALLRTV